MTVDHQASEFAQGLLVEAIDASYKMGYVEAIARASANPMWGATKTIKSFGKRAFQHWFKHATASSLQDIRIYETVRRTLSWHYVFDMNRILNSVASLDSSRSEEHTSELQSRG